MYRTNVALSNILYLFGSYHLFMRRQGNRTNLSFPNDASQIKAAFGGMSMKICYLRIAEEPRDNGTQSNALGKIGVDHLP